MSKLHNDLANCIRFLSIDAVQKANSGHPGMPMGMADVVTVLFKNFLRFNPKNPDWLNRDRFVLSAGHGSMLLYSLLYLTGYKSISLNDIKKFRKLNSICAGHPEYHPKTGIETTTGPLGQGIANAVGFAIAEEILKRKLGKEIINHKTYVLAGDGCLMEGISHEAMSLAGHLKLKNLVMLFDNNSISIDGPTSLAVSDNHEKRFKSYGWDYLNINGHNFKEISKALKKAQKSKKPIAISCKTTIGYGSPNKSGKASSHGSPLGEDEIKLVRKKLFWKHDPFKIPNDLLNEWKKIGAVASKKAKKHQNKFKNITSSKEILKSFNSSIEKIKNNYLKNPKPIATRKSSEIFLDIISKLPNLIGGSADLAGSNNTKTKDHKIIKPGDFSGNYIHYGVREHAMCGIMNGVALHSNFIPYGGTFLIFSDYCKPSIRLAAMMEQRVIYVFTHDSIGLGEDGPTHQPIEHLMSLRLIPGLDVIRPSNSAEIAYSYNYLFSNTDSPKALSLTRQNLEYLDYEVDYKDFLYGGFIISEGEDFTIFASGSEVNIALELKERFEQYSVRVVSVPILNKLTPEKSKTLNNNKLAFTIELGKSIGWSDYIGNVTESFSIQTFGKSAPMEDLGKFFEINVDSIAKKIKSYLD